jgi:hypothetical protein
MRKISEDCGDSRGSPLSEKPCRRTSRERAEHLDMASPDGDAEQLERFLLRRGVGSLTADRDRCADCDRTPLVGERIHTYERCAGIICELCSQLRRGIPLASELVRHSELGHTVRLTARAA